MKGLIYRGVTHSFADFKFDRLLYNEVEFNFVYQGLFRVFLSLSV